jgi:hypothetical protein
MESAFYIDADSAIMPVPKFNTSAVPKFNTSMGVLDYSAAWAEFHQHRDGQQQMHCFTL